VILAICRPGDKVILPSPYWGNFEGIFTQVKAGLVRLHNKLEEDYLISPVELKKTLTANPETKILILCNPSNPAGTLHSPEHLEEVAAVLRKPQFRHVVVISDEIYEQLVYRTKAFPRVLQELRYDPRHVRAYDQRVLQGLRHDRPARRLHG
jgi:aspartate/methionine/tyrosine aminotransferase